MNAQLANLAQRRERLISTIAEQRRQLGQAFTALERPLHTLDRIRQFARYVLARRISVWAVLTLFAVGKRLLRPRRRVARATRVRATPE